MSEGGDYFQHESHSSPGSLPRRNPATYGLQTSPPPTLSGVTSSSNSTGTSGTRSTSTTSWGAVASADQFLAPFSGSQSESAFLRRTVTLPAPVQHRGNSFYLGPAVPLVRSATDSSSPPDIIPYFQPHATSSRHTILDVSNNPRQLPNETPTLASDSLARRFVTSVAEIVEALANQQDTSILSPETVDTLQVASVPVVPETVGSRQPSQIRTSVEVEHAKGKHRRVDDEDENLGESSKIPANIKRKRKPQSVTLASRSARTSQRPGRKYEMQWRLGQAPTPSIRDTKEESNFERVLTAISGYHQGNAAGIWKTVMLQNTAEFDGNGLTETISVSVMLAAGFIAAGQSDSASQVLNRTLPLARVMLLSQHPQLCFYLTEISMDTSKTVAGSLRTSWKNYLAPLAVNVLGQRHPISILLGTPLTVEQKVRMRREGQRVAHQEHVRAFGTYSYQTMVHLWYWARLTAASGDVAESVRMLESLTQAWEQVYSANSAVSIAAIVEQARVMLASGDASVKVECLLGDALRRNDVLSSGQALQPQFMDAAESRLRESSLIFSRLAAFRCLGRLHVMRSNLGNAICCLQQALDIAESNLAEESSVRKMCMTDLAAVKMMELEQSMGGLTLTDPMSRLPPITSIIPFSPVEKTGTKIV